MERLFQPDGLPRYLALALLSSSQDQQEESKFLPSRGLLKTSGSCLRLQRSLLVHPLWRWEGVHGLEDSLAGGGKVMMVMKMIMMMIICWLPSFQVPFNNNNVLQEVTDDDIPVIVDKCQIRLQVRSFEETVFDGPHGREIVNSYTEWQKLSKGLRRKVWTQTKMLSPNIRYFVAIFRFVAIYTLFGRLWAKKCSFGSKTVFLGQEVHYNMVHVA